MALARGRRSYRHIDYWPGFVDALSTLLLAIMFLLSVFVLAQFLLSCSRKPGKVRLQLQEGKVLFCS